MSLPLVLVTVSCISPSEGGFGTRQLIVMDFLFHKVIDFVQIVVGDFIPGSAHAHFQLQRPNIRLRDPATNQIVDEMKSNVPDYLSLHGK